MARNGMTYVIAMLTIGMIICSTIIADEFDDTIPKEFWISSYYINTRASELERCWKKCQNTYHPQYESEKLKKCMDQCFVKYGPKKVTKKLEKEKEKEKEKRKRMRMRMRMNENAMFYILYT
ncbi:hypothetical protein AAHE18_03G166400 [Arachis hypogaea]|nr:uncharacterized protein DS421_3g80980 [Arachis hypogaea]